VLPSRKDKKYCSKECMKAEFRVCTNPICGKKYYVALSVFKKGRGKYCSKECRSEHLGTRLMVKCLNQNCIKLIQLYKCHFDHNIGRYCSKESKPSKKTGQIIQCGKCGKDFYVTPAQVGIRKNCNMKCYRKGDLTPLHKKIRHLTI
jgi:hypothetical protein